VATIGASPQSTWNAVGSPGVKQGAGQALCALNDDLGAGVKQPGMNVCMYQQPTKDGHHVFSRVLGRLSTAVVELDKPNLLQL
jgi:hypothetical protein